MKSKKVIQAAQIGLVAGGLALANPVYAATDAQVDQQMQQVLSETQQLQSEVKDLQAQLKQVKQQKAQSASASSSAKSASYNGKKHPLHHEKPIRGTATPYPKGVSGVPEHEEDFLKHLRAEEYTHGVTVTGSPYLGLRSAYDGSDLIVNISTMNEDLRLLKQRQQLQQDLKAQGLSLPEIEHPIIELSGAIEGQGIYQSNFPVAGSTENPSHSDIDLTRAEFDILTHVSPWVLGLATMNYDNSPLPANIYSSGERYENSRVYLKRGFLTIGNLDQFPFYFSLGQMYVPFGAYSNYNLTNPVTTTLGQTNERTALLGFFKDGIYASTYAFRGDTVVSNSQAINNGGINLGYGFNGSPLSFDFGGGYILNITDALGFQNTGSFTNGFLNGGFGFSSGSVLNTAGVLVPSTEAIVRRVPGIDLHGQIGINQFSLESEWVAASRSFDPANLSYNGRGAQPEGFDIEGDYKFTTFTKPSVFSLTYNHTWEALALNLPQNSYIVDYTISIWKNTIEELEFRHDINYPAGNFAGGSGTTNGALLPFGLGSPGSSQDIAILQFGVYF